MFQPRPRCAGEAPPDARSSGERRRRRERIYQSRGLTPLQHLAVEVHGAGRLRDAGDGLEGDREGVVGVALGERREPEERAPAASTLNTPAGTGWEPASAQSS